MAEGSIFVQWNDPFSQAANRAAFPRILSDASADGRMTVGPWLTRPFDALQAELAVIQSAGDLLVLEAEIPAYANGAPNPQAVNWPAVVERLRPYALPKAVATSFGPFIGADGRPDQALADPLIEAGWYCLPYVYPAEHHGVTVEGQVFYASHYGPEWSHAEPVLGCYSGPFGSYDLSSDAFDGYLEQPGASVWDAGSVL